MKYDIKTLDVLDLLEELRDRGLLVGQLGTVVEILDDGVYEVEFCDNEGRTSDSLALRADQLMALHDRNITISVAKMVQKALDEAIASKATNDKK